VNVIRAVVIDIETGIVLARITEPYDGPWARCKESDAQKQAQAKQNEFNDSLLTIYKQQFAEQQQILTHLSAPLEAMAEHPEGFGIDEYHALQAKIINDVGAQYSAAAKQNALEFATTNEAGLPSGVELTIEAATRAAAASAVAGKSTDLAIANEQLKQQQKEFALGNLESEAGLLGSETTATGGQAGSGLQSEFQNATTVYNQGSTWKNILNGVVGAGMGFLTGGLSNIVGGGGFLSPKAAPSGGGGGG